MYTENTARDIFLFFKASLSNLLARHLPALYWKAKQDTGRGEGNEDVLGVAQYFVTCLNDYREQLGLSEEEFAEDLKGKAVLEYGPGDVLGVALLMYAHGAESVDCIDRFPLEKTTPKNCLIYRAIMDTLDPKARQRAGLAFNTPGLPESGFNPSCIRYVITEDGLVGCELKYDLVISRAVLEHVNSLERTLGDICNALRMGGISVHKVDLTSHGLDRYRPFDFLTWPDWTYRAMYSHKGYPNRWRVDKYKEIIAAIPVEVKKIAPTGELEHDRLHHIYSSLPQAFKKVPPNDLRWLGFWLVLGRGSSEYPVS